MSPAPTLDDETGLGHSPLPRYLDTESERFEGPRLPLGIKPL